MIANEIGKIGELECDFILRNLQTQYCYIQVSMSIMASKSTEDREYRALEMIKDNYPKYVLTLKDFLQQRNGIIHQNLPPFMKEGKLFC